MSSTNWESVIQSPRIKLRFHIKICISQQLKCKVERWSIERRLGGERRVCYENLIEPTFLTEKNENGDSVLKFCLEMNKN